MNWKSVFQLFFPSLALHFAERLSDWKLVWEISEKTCCCVCKWQVLTTPGRVRGRQGERDRIQMQNERKTHTREKNQPNTKFKVSRSKFISLQKTPKNRETSIRMRCVMTFTNWSVFANTPSKDRRVFSFWILG